MKSLTLPCYGIKVLFDCKTKSGKITPGRKVTGREFDALHAMILSHAIAGVDIESPAYIEGIETAVDAIGNIEGGEA
jgi:hypothetical protein|tara:strand:+ start:311 stop:541 length:231 start_codon:yes stop_codon:yes gene_type:complete